MAADYGVVGEGEELVVELADQIAAGKAPKPGIIEARRSPNPWRPVRYQESTAKFYTKRGGMLNLQSKRGCPNACAYCSYPTLEGRTLRLRDPEEVADEFIRLHEELAASYIFFADAVFNDHQGHFREVCEALIKRQNKIPWCAFFRPAGLDKETIQLMKRAGLAAMEFGTDAASSQTLLGLNKGFTFDEVIEANEAAVQAQVPAAHFVIFGGPGEDKKTVQEGLRNIELLRNSVVFAFIGIRILPGTKIHEIAIHEGLDPENDLLEPTFYYSPKIKSSEIDGMIREAWQGRFDRLYPWSGMDLLIKRRHQKGFIGPMWDYLVQK